MAYVDYSDTAARIPDAPPRPLIYSRVHDIDTEDRDNNPHLKVAGAHLNALANEVRALYDWLDVGNLGGDSAQAVFWRGGDPLEVGMRVAVRMPYNGTIVRCSLGAPIEAGTVRVDVRRSTHAGFPPAASICGSNQPRLLNEQTYEDEVLSGWTTRINEGEWLLFYIEGLEPGTTTPGGPVTTSPFPYGPTVTNLTVELKFSRAPLPTTTTPAPTTTTAGPQPTTTTAGPPPTTTTAGPPEPTTTTAGCDCPPSCDGCSNTYSVAGLGSTDCGVNGTCTDPSPTGARTGCSWASAATGPCTIQALSCVDGYWQFNVKHDPSSDTCMFRRCAEGAGDCPDGVYQHVGGDCNDCPATVTLS